MAETKDKNPKKRSRIPESLKSELEKLKKGETKIGDVKSPLPVTEQPVESVTEIKQENITQGDPERGESVGGMSVINKPYKTGTGGKIDVEFDEPMLAKNEKVNEIIEKRKKDPNLTKDIYDKRQAPQIPEFITAQDNTRVNLADDKGNVNVETPEGTTIPVQTQIPGKPLEEHAGDLAVTFGNAFNTWVNDQFQNIVNPQEQGIPLNPLFDIPFSEQLTKFLPGYQNPRYKSTENLPSFIKDFKLKDDYKYSDKAPEAPVEFIGHLSASLVPLTLASMMGLPPTVSMPLINEAGLQQRLKNREVSEGDANWERAAVTLMGGIFDMPITKTLFKEIQSLPIKESTKIGITKAGDVIFKTVGTGMIDAMSQIAQGKKPDMNEVAINAGTIFVMELMGGHQKIKKLSEKFGDERLLDFAKKFARGEKLDPEIQADIEAIHNKPITDVRRLLVGPREHKFEVGPDGKVVEIKRNEPQDMLLSTLEREYGMKPDELRAARENLNKSPNVNQQGLAPGNLITDKNKMLPPKREANFKIDNVGNVVPIEYKRPEAMLVSKPKETGMSGKEIEKSQRRIGENPNIEKGVNAVKDPVTDSRIKQMEREFEAAKQKKESYPVWVEKNRDLYLNENPEVRGKFKAFADKVQEYNRTKSVVEEVPVEVKESSKQLEQPKEKPVIERQTSQPPIKAEKDPLGSKEPLPLGKGETTSTLAPGDKVKSRNYRNPEEVLTVVDPRKDNMVKVRDAKGNESLVSKGSVAKVTGSKLQAPRQELEKIAGEVRKSRGKRREQLAEDMLKKYEAYKQQYFEETGTEFTADKKSDTGKVLEYIEAKKKIAENKGKFGLQSSLLPGGFNPENLPEYVKIGKYHYENLKKSVKDKAVTYGDWAIEMVKEFSDYVRPHLRTIWTEMKKTSEGTPPSPPLQGGKESSQKPRPERVSQQGDFGFGDKGNINENPVKTPFKGGDVSTSEPVKGKGWRADELIDEYRALKQRRSQFEEGSEKYNQITKNMEEMKRKIETLQDVSARNKRMDKETNTRGKRDLYNETLRKLPEYESKANEQGFTGEDAYEQMRKLIRKDLLNDEAFQVMSLREKQFLQHSLDAEFDRLNMSRLRLGTEFFEPYTEHGLKQFLKGSLRQSTKIVQKMGEGGREMVERIKKFNDRRRELMGKPSVVVLKAGKLNKAEYDNLTAIRKAMMMETGLVPEPMNAKVKEVNDALNKYYEETARLVRQRGFETVNPSTGEVYGFTPKKDYDPRVLEITLDKLGVARDKNGEPIYSAARKRQVQYMVESGQARNTAEASELLDSYIKIKTTVSKAGNVEFARVKDIEFAPEMYIQDPVKRMINYAVKISERVAHEENFGMDGNIASRLLSRIEAEGYNKEFAGELYRLEKGGGLTEKELKQLKWVNWLKGANTVTKFSFFTTVRNAPQGLLNSAVRGNLSSAVRGFLNAYKLSSKENAYMSGALADSIESIVLKELAGTTGQVDKMSKSYQYLKKIGWKEGDNLTGYFLRNIGFTANERFNRVIGSTAGEIFYRDMLSRIKNDSMLKKRAYREMEKMFGKEKGDEIIKRGEFTADELNTIRRTFAGDTQFNVRPGDLPLFWSSPWGKLVTQWKSWGYKQTQFIHQNVIKELKNGNPFPMITMMTTFGVTGEAINMLIDGVRGMFGFNPKKKGADEDETWYDRSAIGKLQAGKMDEFAYRMLEDMAGLGAFSLIYDVYRSVGYGKSPTGDISQGVSSVVLGPTLSVGGRLISDMLFPLFNLDKADEEKTWITMAKNVYRNVMTNVLPYGGIIRSFGITKNVEDWLFGKKITDKQRKYEQLKNSGVDVKVLEDIEAQEKQLKELHRKALETRQKSDIDAYWKADEDLDKLKESSQEYQKLMEIELNEKRESDELLGKGKFKIWNELKNKGVNIEVLKDIDNREREVKKLKDTAERTRAQKDVNTFKRADYDLEKLKAKSVEWREYVKMKNKIGEEKKKERESLFK
jgi:hypothetical protein